MPRSTKQQRYLQPLTSGGPGNSVQGSFGLAAGRRNLATLGGPTSYTRPMGIMPHRGLDLSFMGTGAENSGYSFRIWQVFTEVDANGQPTKFGELVLFGSGVATLSATSGPSGSVVCGAADVLADTITWAASAAGAKYEAAYGSTGSLAYSPADDTPAHLLIPDLGNADAYIIEFAITALGATGANAVASEGT